MRAVIIGAGIAGLAAALRLRQIGWESLIIERAPQRRSGGYGVAFGGIGYDAAERMGILPALEDKAFITKELVYHKANGQRSFSLTRETIAATMGNRSMNILRGDVETVLYEAVRDTTEIRFATTIDAVDQNERAVHVTSATARSNTPICSSAPTACIRPRARWPSAPKRTIASTLTTWSPSTCSKSGRRPSRREPPAPFPQAAAPLP
jgi:2-polyprenyl-6-methoxyphenol hydroxylase-like FAD-dependent oxidoreductase